MAPKAKPKPSLSAANAQTPSLEDLFSSLHRHSEKFEYDQCVKIADQVLSIAPGDEDAIRCKIVALIKSDSMDKALSAILAAEGLPIDLKFYKAYCLYRQNKLQDALESLNNQERSPMVLQLESQILYRLGKMDACMQSYEKLQKIKVDSIDVKTNIIATLVSAGRSNEVQGVMDALKVKASNSFELAYNTACSLIEKKKYAEAEQQLLSARRIGQEMLMEEDYADEEIETELAPISVQLAYIQQLLGRKHEAMEAYTNIISRNLADAPSLAIATNNLIALKGGAKDASDGLRKLDKLMEKKGEDGSFKLAGGLDFKLSQRQKESLYANRLLLLLHTNRMDQARELASALPEMFPGSTVAVLLQAAVLVKEKKIPRVEELLLHFAEKFPEKSKAILLARAQISAAGGRPQIAAESLSMMHDIRHMPAVVATMVSLKERVGDLEGACSALDSTIQFWSEGAMMTEEDNRVMLGVIMPEAAAFKLRHGREGEAFELYERLVKQHGKNSNAEALAGLVKTAARIDLAKAELYERWLKELPGTIADAETLEKSCGAATGKMEEKEEKQSKGKRKRKRKAKRYPKGFDPANPGPPPDPERWLPRKERSSYRPKRKDKRVLQVRGSQGAVARDKHHDSNTSSSSSAAAAPNNNAPPTQKLPGQISKGRRKK